MDPLAQLKDIHVPPEVGLWPLSYGWWVLACLLVIALVATGIAVRNYYRRRKARRQALCSLSLISKEHQDWPNQVNQVLKRAALSYFPVAEVASLHSQQWLTFLTRQLSPRDQDSFKQDLEPMLAAQFSPAAELEFDSAHAAAQTWLRKALPPKAAQQGGQNV